MTNYVGQLHKGAEQRRRILHRRKRMYCWKRSDLQVYRTIAKYDNTVVVTEFDPPRTVPDSVTPIIGMAEIRDAQEGDVL